MLACATHRFAIQEFMETFSGRIGIVGAGALGAFYGARLARAGHDVHFLMRRDYEAVRANGLTVRSIDGDFHLRPAVYRSAEEMGPCDLTIVGLKTTDNHALPSLLQPVTATGGLVLTLQNGLGNEEAIAAALGGGPEAEERVLGGTAFLCSNRSAPGVVNHMAQGWVRLAEFRGPARARTHAIAALFTSAGIPCEVRESVADIRWHKLVWNVPFNGLGVAAGHANTADILADDELALIVRDLMGEVVAAAAGEGVAIEPSFIDYMIEVTPKMGGYRTSMQIDYEEGRPLEVEAILGEPLRRARRAGVTVPRMQTLYALVRRLDALRRATQP
jgi:2-dehydropantoate 2-reductase